MCKMAHLGNCDPETADQEYCIFHKPDKSEEEVAEFYRKFLERFNPRVEEIGVDGKKIKRLVFDGPVDARGFVFPRINPQFPLFLLALEDIDEIVFVDKVDFERAIFEGDVAFIGTVFKKDVIFAYSRFKGDAFFAHSHFEGDVYFDKVHFERGYSFFETKFKNVSFCMSEFDGIGQGMKGPLVLGFNRCEFSGESDFYKVRFHDNVSFEGAVFKKYTLFFGAIFEKDVNFKHVKFDFTSGSEWVIPKYQKTWELPYLRALHRQTGAESKKDEDMIFRYISPDEIDYEMILGGDIEKTFRKALFKGPAKFSYSMFRGFADFENARFENDVEFIKVIFGEETDFLNVVFNGKAIFNYSTFKKKVYFAWPPEGRVTLESAIFKGSSSFNGVNFGDIASFTGVKFMREIDFSYVTFGGRAIFTKTTFHGQSYFISSEFFGNAEFYNAKFHDWSTFAHSTFGDTTFFDFAEFEKAIFNFAMFEKGASFKNVTFHGTAWFKEVEFKKAVEFQAAEFKGKTTFEGSIFERLAIFVNEKRTLNEPAPKFHDELSFSNCDFRQGADFLGSLKNEGSISALWDFFSSRFSRLQSLIEAVRIQRLSFEKEGKRDEADRMFVLEMRAKRKIRKSKLSESAVQKATSIWGVRHLLNLQDRLTRWLFKSSNPWKELLKLLVAIIPMVFMVLLVTFSIAIFQFIYLLGYIGEVILGDWISLYGTSWERVIGVSLLVIIGNAVPYTIWSKLIEGFPETSGYFIRFANALYYSLVTFTTLGYGDMHPTGWLKALSAIEALTGAVFMALIVAVIARKWMR